MITHEQLLAMWEEDAVIERTQLDRESLAIPKLHHKYLQILMDIRSKKVAFTHQLETLKKEKPRNQKLRSNYRVFCFSNSEVVLRITT